MPPNKSQQYRLTPRALSDLDHIWFYTFETWSVTQADSYIDALTGCFEKLAAMPEMARERAEFMPPVRIHPYQSHLVIYGIEEDGVSIVRVLGGHQDWQEILQDTDA